MTRMIPGPIDTFEILALPDFAMVMEMVYTEPLLEVTSTLDTFVVDFTREHLTLDFLVSTLEPV